MSTRVHQVQLISAIIIPQMNGLNLIFIYKANQRQIIVRHIPLHLSENKGLRLNRSIHFDPTHLNAPLYLKKYKYSHITKIKGVCGLFS